MAKGVRMAKPTLFISLCYIEFDQYSNHHFTVSNPPGGRGPFKKSLRRVNHAVNHSVNHSFNPQGVYRGIYHHVA